MDFGKFVKEKRIAIQISLRSLARELGISPSYLSDIENGNRKALSSEKLELLVNALRLNEEDAQTMYDLAGQALNELPPDVPQYLLKNDAAIAALRRAKELDASEEEWLKFIKELEENRGK